MKEIKYDKDILKVINELSNNLTKEMILRKVDDTVFIKKVEKSLSMFVEFSTPSSSFDFEGETLAFAEGVYSEFYKFFNLFENPSLNQDGIKLVLKENNKTIKFSPSNPEIIKNELKASKPFPKPISSFTLSKEHFNYAKKMIKMVDSKEVQFKVKGNQLEILISNNVSDNTSNITFELETPVEKELDLFLNTVIFEVAPSLDYVVNIIPDAKTFQFVSVNEKFTLNLYTGLKIV